MNPGNAHGFCYALRSFTHVRGWGRLSTSRTHLPFGRLPAASFIVAGSFDQGEIGGGFWGLAPRTSRAVRSVGPAKAFAHRAESNSPAMTALSFWSFLGIYSPASGLHFWSLSAHGLFAPCRDESAVFRRDIARALDVLRGRRLADPAVFPPDQQSRPRFLRRPQNVHRIAPMRYPARSFLRTRGASFYG